MNMDKEFLDTCYRMGHQHSLDIAKADVEYHDNMIRVHDDYKKTLKDHTHKFNLAEQSYLTYHAGIVLEAHMEALNTALESGKITKAAHTKAVMMTKKALADHKSKIEGTA